MKNPGSGFVEFKFTAEQRQEILDLGLALEDIPFLERLTDRFEKEQKSRRDRLDRKAIRAEIKKAEGWAKKLKQWLDDPPSEVMHLIKAYRYHDRDRLEFDGLSQNLASFLEALSLAPSQLQDTGRIGGHRGDIDLLLYELSLVFEKRKLEVSERQTGPFHSLMKLLLAAAGVYNKDINDYVRSHIRRFLTR